MRNNPPEESFDPADPAQPPHPFPPTPVDPAAPVVHPTHQRKAESKTKFFLIAVAVIVAAAWVMSKF